MSKPQCTAAMRVQPDLSKSLQACQWNGLSPSGGLLHEVSFCIMQAAPVKRSYPDYRLILR